MNVEGAYTRCTHMCYLIDSAVMISCVVNVKRNYEKICHIACVYNFFYILALPAIPVSQKKTNFNEWF